MSAVTSVKEIHIDVPPTPTALGTGSFVFTDDYSVFDWGKMPDPIPEKGISLCTMGAYNFERLETAGIPTHYRGVIEDDAVIELADTTAPPREMGIDLAQVPDLPYTGSGYDYDAYHATAGDSYLVPLEIVFRNTVPIGSSLRGRTSPTDHGLGFTTWPDTPVELADPIVEFSTKFEEQDRYLDSDEAARIAGDADITDLEAIARAVNDLVTARAAEIGMDHQDGKIECLYHDGSVRVADVAGTFDENRFAYRGQQLSKEVLRQYYKDHHPDWVEAVSAAKAEATQRDLADWRQLCEVQPPPLPDHVVQAASDLYSAGTNTYTGRNWIDAPDLDTAIQRVRDLADR